MRHADEIIERILYLDGMPNLQRLGSVRLGETVPEQFRLDLELERAALERFNNGIAQAARPATTAPARCSRRCWCPRKTTSTGSRPS